MVIRICCFIFLALTLSFSLRFSFVGCAIVVVVVSHVRRRIQRVLHWCIITGPWSMALGINANEKPSETKIIHFLGLKPFCRYAEMIETMCRCAGISQIMMHSHCNIHCVFCSWIVYQLVVIGAFAAPTSPLSFSLSLFHWRVHIPTHRWLAWQFKSLITIFHSSMHTFLLLLL